MPRPAIVFAAALLVATPALADDAGDIEARIDAFATAFNAGDAAGVAALYTEDAVVLPPDGPFVRGREAIQAMWQDAIDGGFEDLALEPEEIEIAGDTAYEMATLSLNIAGEGGEGGETPYSGKYIVVWKKGDEGWRMHRDIWNAMPAE